MVDQLGDLVHALGEAEGTDRAKDYHGLGLRLRYDYRRLTVRDEAQLWGTVG